MDEATKDKKMQIEEKEKECLKIYQKKQK